MRQFDLIERDLDYLRRLTDDASRDSLHMHLPAVRQAMLDLIAERDRLIDVLHDVKLRIIFVGWPVEPMWSPNGISIPDWRPQLKSIEEVLSVATPPDGFAKLGGDTWAIGPKLTVLGGIFSESLKCWIIPITNLTEAIRIRDEHEAAQAQRRGQIAAEIAAKRQRREREVLRSRRRDHGPAR